MKRPHYISEHIARHIEQVQTDWLEALTKTTDTYLKDITVKRKTALDKFRDRIDRTYQQKMRRPTAVIVTGPQYDALVEEAGVDGDGLDTIYGVQIVQAGKGGVVEDLRYEDLEPDKRFEVVTRSDLTQMWQPRLPYAVIDTDAEPGARQTVAEFVSRSDAEAFAEQYNDRAA